jgi:hypothetical protein
VTASGQPLRRGVADLVVLDRVHSYERASYLRSLVLLDRPRTTRMLPLFLLDCEPAVRLLAAQHTALTGQARYWIIQLRDDVRDIQVLLAALDRLADRWCGYDTLTEDLARILADVSSCAHARARAGARLVRQLRGLLIASPGSQVRVRVEHSGRFLLGLWRAFTVRHCRQR